MVTGVASSVDMWSEMHVRAAPDDVRHLRQQLPLSCEEEKPTEALSWPVRAPALATDEELGEQLLRSGG